MGCNASKSSASQDGSATSEEKTDKGNEAAAAEAAEKSKTAKGLKEEETKDTSKEAEKANTARVSEKSEEGGAAVEEVLSEGTKTKKWNEAAVEMAESAKLAKDLTVDQRVELIEKNHATIWKLNHDNTDGDSLRKVVDTSSYSEDVKDSWNWRRRFCQVSVDVGNVHIKYLSEKANLEHVDLCSLPRTGNVQIFDLPKMDFKHLEGQDLQDRWEHSQEHELCVGFNELKKALDVHYGFPKHVFPVLVAWRDSTNTPNSVVLALVSKASKQAWLQCLSKSLPGALQGQPQVDKV